MPGEIQLLLTPTAAAALSASMQALRRRYVGAYNRRHGCSGTLWDGRFRCAVVEGGAPVLKVLSLIDGLGMGSRHAARGGSRRHPARAQPGLVQRQRPAGRAPPSVADRPA